MEILDNTTGVVYKKKLLNLFSKFITFCDDFSLNYFCTGGTLLGAVRHHGFIPWDDDVDLFMKRKDYEKLISLKQELYDRGIGLEGIQCNDKFGVFLKIWDLSTTLWEIEEIPFVYGIFIDIFPLDYSNDTNVQFVRKYKTIRRLFSMYQLSHMRISFKSFYRRFDQKDYKFITKGLLSLLVPRFLGNYIRNKILREDKKNQNNEGSHFASYYGDYWEREFFPKSWFESYELADFENLKVKIPVGYDGYLKQIYHDYMKLPPKEKQVTHHYHYFLDLDAHYNIKQVKQKLRKK